MRKYAIFYTALLFVFVFALLVVNFNPFVGDSKAQQRRFGRNLQVLTHVESTEQWQKIKEGMVKSLGVKCNYCHNVNNYASDEKETKKKARVMLKMVMTINRDFINWEGAEVVDCYTCHRGQTKPQVRASSK